MDFRTFFILFFFKLKETISIQKPRRSGRKNEEWKEQCGGEKIKRYFHLKQKL